MSPDYPTILISDISGATDTTVCVWRTRVPEDEPLLRELSKAERLRAEIRRREVEHLLRKAVAAAQKAEAGLVAVSKPEPRLPRRRPATGPQGPAKAWPASVRAYARR